MSEPHRPDSLAALGRGVTGQRFQKALPWIAGALMSVATGIASWAAAKLDVKAEMAETIALHHALLESETLRATRHKEVLDRFEALDVKLFSESLIEPGKIKRLERAQYFVWRAVTENRAAAYAGETAKARAQKQAIAANFARSFDARALDGTPPATVYDQLVAQVAVQ